MGMGMNICLSLFLHIITHALPGKWQAKTPKAHSATAEAHTALTRGWASESGLKRVLRRLRALVCLGQKFSEDGAYLHPRSG